MGDYYATLWKSIQKKLNPAHFPDMKPMFSLLVRAILKLALRKNLYLDADGLIFDEEEVFLGNRQWLLEHWEALITSPTAGLTTEERQEARAILRCWLRIWRDEAPDRKPHIEKIAQVISMICKVNDNLQEIAALIIEIMSPKDRKAIYN